MKALPLIALAIAAAVGDPALVVATMLPQARLPDPRIHIVPYIADEIVPIRAALGYQLMIEFGGDERIENVAIGDSLGWQITPNRKADLLFVKPMDKVPVTNMTVVTNQRHYLFEMIVDIAPAHHGHAPVMYALQFQYPKEAAVAPEPAQPQLPQVVNSAYSYTGSTTTLPTRIFDDGHSTFFQFREGEDYPAIFTVEGDKGEAVVNSSTRGGYIVVDQVARRFTLRRGSDVTSIFNDGFREAAPGPLSPQPRAASSCWFFCP